MTRQAISTSGAPAAIGPYSQAMAIDCPALCSGQLGPRPRERATSSMAWRRRRSARCAT